MKNYFETAFDLLDRVYRKGAFLKIVLADLPENAENRALVTKLCYGTVEGDAKYHYQIARLTQGKPLKPHVRLILKMAMYLLSDLGRPAYATINTAVEFSKRFDKGAASGLINAVLRRFLREEMTFVYPERRYERLSVQYSYPLFAVKRLFHTYGEEAEEIIRGGEAVNAVRFAKGVNGGEYFTEQGVEFTPSPFTNLFYAEKFTRNADYEKGIYTFQSVGSVAICDMIAPCERLLDTCAAPGGKSVYLAEKCTSVTAAELHPHRAALIEGYAKRMGATNLTVAVKDATEDREEWHSYFDAVLCDVPCSGYGVLKENPDIKLRASERDFTSLPPLQKEILTRSSTFVKSGGVLYYSTCTLFTEENDGVIAAFLKNNPDFSVEEATSPLPHKKMKYGVQFLPHDAKAGFYFAKLRKK